MIAKKQVPGLSNTEVELSRKYAYHRYFYSSLFAGHREVDVQPKRHIMRVNAPRQNLLREGLQRPSHILEAKEVSNSPLWVATS